MGHFRRIMAENTGDPLRDFAANVPNDGLIRYMHAFNNERLFVTSPKGLAEVLVHKNYDFIKPKQIKTGLGKILGVGVLLAEGLSQHSCPPYINAGGV